MGPRAAALVPVVQKAPKRLDRFRVKLRENVHHQPRSCLVNPCHRRRKIIAKVTMPT